ncbi:unnamed protein product [Lampetra planeri]
MTPSKTVIPPTAPVAGAPSARSDDVLRSAQECVVSPAQPPPPQSWLDITSHLGRFLSAAAHLFEQMTASTFNGFQDTLPAAVTGALDLLTILVAAATLHSYSISGDRSVLQQQLPTSKVEDAPKFRRHPLAIPPTLFDRLTELTHLELDTNQLKSLPPGIFDKLGKLTKLELHHNQLTTVPAGMFGCLVKLQKRYLQGN